MKYILWGLLFVSSTVFAQFSYIPASRTLRPGGVEYDFGADYFQTSKVVDDNGRALNLADGTYYQSLDLSGTGRYGFTKELEMMVSFNARVISAKDIIGTEEYAFNRTGIESATAGFKYGFDEEDGVKYAFEGWYKKALFSNKDYTSGAEPTEIALGEDSREIAIGPSMYIRTNSNNFLSLRVLYRSPAQDLSSEIYSEIEGAMVWSHFAFAIGMENNYSMEGDSYSSDPESKPEIYNGPSEMYNSINRSWSAPYGKVNIALGKTWRIEGRYTQILTGNSTDLGPRISVHLIKRKEDYKEFAKRDSQFKEYTIEGEVSKISNARTACVVNKGLTSGLKEGMPVDFYHFDYVDGNQLIARGVVVKAGASKSMVKILKRYSKERVKEGTVIRAGIITDR